MHPQGKKSKKTDARKKIGQKLHPSAAVLRIGS